MGAAQTEFNHLGSGSGMADAGRLGGNQCLEIDDIEEHGFHQLGFSQGSGDGQERLIGKDHRTFGRGCDTALKTESAQEVKETGFEQAEAAQIVNLHRGEPKILQAVQGGCQAGENGVATRKGIGAEVEIEHRRFISQILLKIACQHGQFVEISEQRRGVHGVLRNGIAGSGRHQTGHRFQTSPWSDKCATPATAVD